MVSKTPQDKLHAFFIFSLAVKLVFGVFETLSSFLFFATGTVTHVLIFLTSQELNEDPHDFLANKIVNFLPAFSAHSQIFIAWYLVIHGLIKIVLIVMLLQQKLWAYPVSLAVLAGFLGYQLYQLANGFSFFLAALSLFDIVVIYLVWHEYNFMRSRISPA